VTARRVSSLALALTVVALAGLALAPWLAVGLAIPPRSLPSTAEGARMVELSGGAVRVEVRGDGPAVLLLHGFNETLDRWAPVWERLADCPVRAVRVDLPGFGGSSWRTDDFGLPAQAPRVLELLDHLGLARATLVGTSMGGSLAAWLAAHHPERIERLLLLAPSGFPGSLHHPGLYGRLLEPGRLNRWATAIARTGLFRRLFPRSAAGPALTVSGSYGAPWRAALPRIVAPTLLAWSEGDTTASADTAEAVHADITGSHLLWLARDAGHGLPSSRPELTAWLACQLALGAAPGGLVIPPALLRPGDGHPGP
jgi:pimeloyl-ACP methyl ester carboxylesterase